MTSIRVTESVANDIILADLADGKIDCSIVLKEGEATKENIKATLELRLLKYGRILVINVK